MIPIRTDGGSDVADALRLLSDRSQFDLDAAPSFGLPRSLSLFNSIPLHLRFGCRRPNGWINFLTNPRIFLHFLRNQTGALPLINVLIIFALRRHAGREGRRFSRHQARCLQVALIYEIRVVRETRL